MFDPPDPTRLDAVNDVTTDRLPRFAPVRQHFSTPPVPDLRHSTVEAIDDVPDLASLPAGSEVAITAGSRGIRDLPAVLETIVETLQDRGLEPFVIPAMGSHGGATAEGQREMLASLGVTEEAMGCEIRSSMEVERIGTDADGRPMFAATDTLAADAVLLLNRVKAHTDFEGDIESGLCKIAVIGLGKQRGAENAHNAALASSFREVLPERAAMLFSAVPIVGGIAILENAEERSAHIEGIPVDEILDREPELLARSKELLPTLPVDDLDLLIVDESGKNVSGTGMDTNVLGRMDVLGEPEPDAPSIARVHVRSITPESHGNGIGIGLADFVHERAVRDLDLTDTYINAITGGEPSRARVPVIVPSDALAMSLAYSSTGVRDPSEMRIAWIENTLELTTLRVSEPVVGELAGRDDVTVGDPEPLRFDDGDLVSRPIESEPA